MIAGCRRRAMVALVLLGSMVRAIPAGAQQPPVEIHFQSTTPDVAFHMHPADVNAAATPGGRYAFFCEAPCRSILTLGPHQLGLSYQDGKPVESTETIAITGPSTVTASYVSRQ